MFYSLIPTPKANLEFIALSSEHKRNCNTGYRPRPFSQQIHSGRRVMKRILFDINMLVYLDVLNSVFLPAIPIGLARLEILVTPVLQGVLVYLVDPLDPSVPLFPSLPGALVLLEDQVDLEFQVHLKDQVHQWGLVVQQRPAPRQALLDLALPVIKSHIQFVLP